MQHVRNGDTKLYTRKLSHEYTRLPKDIKRWLLMEINNSISHNMNWRKIYHIMYNHDEKTLTLTGFDPHTEPRVLFKSPVQLEYMLTKIGYNHAQIILNKHEKIQSLKLFRKQNKNTPRVRTIHDKPIPQHTEEEDDCNILTHEGGAT